MKQFFINIWNKYKVYIIGVLLILILGIALFNTAVSYFDLKKQSKHNLVALTDTIEYYKSKSGKLVAEKTILIGDMSDLKLANEKLYNELKDMKVKNPETVIKVVGTTKFEPQDTIWSTDTIIPNLNIKKEFAFNNDYRSLEGNVTANDSALGLNITKDEMYFDYTAAVKNGKVYITSSNPYVKYDQITGITIPSGKKQWSVGIGPHIGYGYDFRGKQFTPYIGIGINLNYNLFQFGNK